MKNNDKILCMIKQRLDVGAAKYGEQVPIDGSRDNLKESIEEVLDLCVYLSAVVLELHEKYKDAEYRSFLVFYATLPCYSYDNLSSSI